MPGLDVDVSGPGQGHRSLIPADIRRQVGASLQRPLGHPVAAQQPSFDLPHPPTTTELDSPGSVEIATRHVPLASRVVEMPQIAFTEGGKSDWAFTTWGHTQATLNNPDMFSGPPLPEQIRQGEMGDCFALSVLGAVTQVAPHTIEQRMRIDGDRVEVTLFDPDLKQDVSHVLDTTVPWFAVGDRRYVGIAAVPVDGAWWAPMMEKAFAVCAPDGYDGLDDGGDALNQAGLMEMLTGRPPKLVHAGRLHGFSEDVLHGLLEAASALGAPTCLGISGLSHPKVESAALELADRYDAIPGHAYWLRGYDSETRTVHLGNPWGRRHIDLPLDVFRQIASQLVIGEPVENK